MSHQAGRSGAESVSDCKDEPIAIEAGAFNAEEHEAAAVAVSHRDTDSVHGPVPKPHRLNHAEVRSSDAVSLLRPDILNPKIDTNHDIATLAIPPSTASQQNGG